MLFLAQDAASSLTSFLPLLLIGAFFWFVMIRPQRKRAAERKEMIEALDVGSKVVTIGGIHGVVDALGDEWVDLLVTEDVVLRFTRAAIGQVMGPEADAVDDPDRDTDAGVDSLEDSMGTTGDDAVEWPSDDERA